MRSYKRYDFSKKSNRIVLSTFDKLRLQLFRELPDIKERLTSYAVAYMLNNKNFMTLKFTKSDIRAFFVAPANDDSENLAATDAVGFRSFIKIRNRDDELTCMQLAKQSYQVVGGILDLAALPADDNHLGEPVTEHQPSSVSRAKLLSFPTELGVSKPGQPSYHPLRVKQLTIHDVLKRCVHLGPDGSLIDALGDNFLYFLDDNHYYLYYSEHFFGPIFLKVDGKGSVTHRFCKTMMDWAVAEKELKVSYRREEGMVFPAKGHLETLDYFIYSTVRSDREQTLSLSLPSYDAQKKMLHEQHDLPANWVKDLKNEILYDEALIEKMRSVFSPANVEPRQNDYHKTIETIRELKKLHDEQILTDEEFRFKKMDLLARI